MKDKFTRKDFLKRISMLFAGVAGAGSIITACGGGEAPEAKKAAPPPKKKADPCSDYSGLTQAEIDIRSNFNYLKVSPDPAKLCDNCFYWTEPEGDSPCGGCTIIKGPIHAKGYCNQWAVQQS